MPTLLSLFLALTLATFVIAYWSDNLGKKLGKKRITLFRLRPRQTATAISMLSSWVIMIGTLAVLLTTDQSVRNALLRFDELQRDRTQLQEGIAVLRRDSQRYETSARRNRQAAAAARQEAVRVGRLLNTTENRLRVARQEVQTVQERLQGAERERRAAAAAAARANQAAGVAREAESRARRSEVEARRRLARADNRLAIINGLLAGARRNLNERRVELRRAYDSLRQARRDYIKSSKEVLQYYQDIKRLENLSELRAKEVRDLDEQRARLVAQRTELENSLAGIRKVAAYVATGAVSIRREYLLAEATVPPRPSRTEVVRILEQLEKEASAALKEYARERELGELRLRLFTPPIVVDGQTVMLSAEQMLGVLENVLVLSPTPNSLRLVTARDHALEETEILYSIQKVEVKPAYVEGETIASATVDGSQGDARVFNQLLGLLQEGEEAARRRNVLPLITARNPFFYAMDTNERIFEAMRLVRAMGRPVSVRLVAADNLSTTESLRVRVETG